MQLSYYIHNLQLWPRAASDYLACRGFESHGLEQGWRAMRKGYIGKRHSLLSHVFFYFFCPTNVSLLWRICVYLHISDCVGIVYELPWLTNNTASEIFLHKLGAVRSADWVFITTSQSWWWVGEYVTLVKIFIILFSNKKLFPDFLSYRIPRGSLYQKYNIISTLRFNYTM